MLSRWTSLLLLCAVTPAASLNVACETSCSVDEDENPEVVSDGLTDLESGTYESDEWDGKFREFPPKKRYLFLHGLGDVPRDVHAYVAFNESPLAGRRGNVAEAAGDIVIFEAITAEHIQVWNGTCETFYLRVYAGKPRRSPDEGGDGGAGGSG